MEIGYDPAKNDWNIEVRGLSFDRVADCDWEQAFIWQDQRENYGEDRFCAWVPMDERLYCVVYTVRSSTLHIISFRKANKREVRRYEKNRPRND